MPVAIALISGATAFELPWGNIMAASVIVTVPLVVLVLIFQRRIVSGLTAGARQGVSARGQNKRAPPSTVTARQPPSMPATGGAAR